MTVGELRERLKNFPVDLPVVVEGEEADKVIADECCGNRYVRIFKAREAKTMTNKEAASILKCEKVFGDAMIEAHRMAIQALEQEPKTEWIPVKTRPMTKEETEHYFEYTDIRIDDTYTILDCPLPDDGQEVLVSWGGNVVVDVFVRDNEGCYFEGMDIDEVDAWMPLPEPYKESEG